MGENIETLPISFGTDNERAPILKLVQTILANPDSPSVPQLESEINYLVYELYNLNTAEIGLIDKTDKNP